jgi:hypothetical protein
MKRAILVATALLSSSILSSPANATYAPTANPPTEQDMQNVCDALDTDGAGTDVQVVVVPGTVDYGAPAFDTSTITDDEDTRVADHSSSSTPYGTPSFYSQPGRHGGSVNLFATIGYPGITYAGSFVDQNADRTETDTYNFSCQLQHYEIVGSHEEGVPGTPAQGFYTNPQDNSRGDCAGISPANPHWGHDIGACIWTEIAPGTPDTTITVDDYGYVNSGAATPETLTDGPYFYDNTVYATHVSEPTVPVTETDAAPYFSGDVVVCINPGKKGGTWRTQNGWTDLTKCTTTYFNTAPYISGANVFSSNSLPPL